MVASGQADGVTTGGGDGARPTILVVDDDSGVRRACARMLQAAGFRVLTAEGGQDALDRAAESPDPIGLALIDVVMPAMSGPELARKLRERSRATRILFMSGYASSEIDGVVAMEPNEHFLGKPFSADVLERKVHEVLGTAPRP